MSISAFLLWLNIRGKVIKVSYDMYSKAKSCVRIDTADSDHFKTSTGIKQGDNLSTLLFCIYLNDLLEYFAKTL